MKEIITIVGRTNVGKSLLFNKLTRAKKSLVINDDGITRDINTGYLNSNNKYYYIEDTGGIPNKDNEFSDEILSKAIESIEQSNLILFVVSASEGLTNHDIDISKMLRKRNINVVLLINKSDLLSKSYNAAQFYKLGFKKTLSISAKTNVGLPKLINEISKTIIGEEEIDTSIKKRISVVGKPNAGKSTFINALLRQDRMITSDIAGTTLDSIELPFEYKKTKYLFYDTAGLMKKSKTSSLIQKFSISATLETIKNTDICIFIINGEDGITKQDKMIMSIIIRYNKPFIIVLNKIDKISKEKIKNLKDEINYFINIAHNAPFVLVSALQRKNINKVLILISSISRQINKHYKSSKLTDILSNALIDHPPPMKNNKKVRLKFAQQSKAQSLTIIIHGNKTDHLSDSYEKYLMNYFIKELKLTGVPLRIKFSKQKNPFDLGS